MTGLAHFALLLGSAFGPADAPATVDEVSPLAALRLSQRAFRIAAGRIEPAVVTIETIGGALPPSEQAGGRPPGRGGFQLADGPTTGLVYRADGLILTSSFNFVRDPSVITVTLADGRQFVAEMLARDEIHKLTMLRIDATDLPTPRWCPRDDVRVGIWAIALGRGFGAERSAVTVGILSALERFDGLVVQTDAKLSPGNYGGPLIDIEGRVIGICLPMAASRGEMAGVAFYDSGVGFAIPGWRIERVAERLARGEWVRRGWIGVRIEPAASGGVGITSVPEGSPAHAAGLEAGDVIVGIDDVDVADPTDLQRIMVTRTDGETIAVRIRRQEETLTRNVTLRRFSDIEGLTLSPPTSAPTTQPSTRPATQPTTKPAD